MNFTINISEEQLEEHLLKLIPRTWDLKIIKSQFKIKGGVIDILAKYNEYENTYFVIELKVGELTPDSVCQVLRYTQYMNSEMSKGGKRVFYPLLIGNKITTEQSNGHLYKLLKRFDGEPDDTFYVQYSLYDLGLNGITLGWYYNPNNDFIMSTYDKFHSRITDIEEENNELKLEIYCTRKKIKELESKENKK